MNDKELQKMQCEDLQTVLKTPQGRRVLWRILQATRIQQTPFVPADACSTAFHCGQQSIGLFLQAEIEQAAPLAYIQMKGEYQAQIDCEQHVINRLQEELNDVS